MISIVFFAWLEGQLQFHVASFKLALFEGTSRRLAPVSLEAEAWVVS